MSGRARTQLLPPRRQGRGIVDHNALIEHAVRRSAPDAVRLRHQIHANPELANREFATAATVAAALRKLGLQVTEGVARTGVVALLRGARPGPTVAVRADMDALPVTEDTPFPFRSTVRSIYLGQEVSVSHACGHDVHTAILVGVAGVLSALRDELPGTVKLIFQPAEEGPPPGESGGAELMIRQGVLRDPVPEAIFALHSFPELEVGNAGYTIGPAWAAVDRFEATLRGKQAHAAKPEFGIDPVVMAAETVMALQCIRSRSLSSLEPSVVTVASIHGGERFNIIPGAVRIAGTVRTYSEQVRTEAETRMQQILDGVSRTHGGSFDLDYVRRTPTLVNDADLAPGVIASLESALGRANVTEVPPSMGGEDFARFAQEVPCFCFRLGTCKPGGTSGGLHTPDFMADDGAVRVGMRAMATVLVDALHSDR